MTVTFRKREYYMRSILILTISTFLLQAFLGQGKGPTYMLFFRKEFKMTEKQYGIKRKRITNTYMQVMLMLFSKGPFVVFFGVLSLVAQFVLLPLLSQRAGLHDALIGVLAVSGHAIEALMQAFLRKIWMLVLG